MDSPRVNGNGPVQENDTQVWRLEGSPTLQDELEIRRLRLQGLFRDDEEQAA